MFRRFLLAALTTILAACSPELIPRPGPPTPSPVPPTATSIPINAPAVSALALATFHMLDERNGWGVSDTSVLRTEDGGKTWYALNPKGAQPLGYSVVTSILDAQHAWVLVPDQSDMLKGTLYSTTDGGINWKSQPVPFGGGDLEMLDAKNGWMLASLGAGAGSMGVAVYQTRDGGASWLQNYTNDPNQPNAGDSLPLGGLKDGLTPVDAQSAFVGGVIYTPGTTYLYHTGDAGATWQSVPVKAPDGYDQAEMETRGPVFVTANTGYLPVTVSAQEGVLLAIYVTKDGGKSWLITPTMIPQGGAMDFVSSQDGFVWNGSKFYKTHDGAQSWTTVAPDVSFGESFSGMDFVDPTTGWVITSDASGARGLYMTADGGATWNVLGK